MTRTTLPFCVDCVEVYDCDNNNSTQSPIAVGMYEYDPTASVRNGGVVFFNQQGKEVERILCGGVLDMVWLDSSTLVTACADGTVGLVQVKGVGIRNRNDEHEDEDVVGSMSKFGTHSANANCSVTKFTSEGDSALGITLAVDHTHHTTASSHGSGAVCIWDIETKSTLSQKSTGMYEAWALCVSATTNGNVVYSGGDDGVLVGWDVRSGAQIVKKKDWEVGVTCITELGDGMMVVGSYDEGIRMFDPRKGWQEVKRWDGFGGGIWRIKEDQGTVGMACMRGGWWMGGNDGWKRMGEDVGEDLAYGFAWRGSGLWIGGSFYDKSVWWNGAE